MVDSGTCVVVVVDFVVAADSFAVEVADKVVAIVGFGQMSEHSKHSQRLSCCTVKFLMMTCRESLCGMQINILFKILIDSILQQRVLPLNEQPVAHSFFLTSGPITVHV